MSRVLMVTSPPIPYKEPKNECRVMMKDQCVSEMGDQIHKKVLA